VRTAVVDYYSVVLASLSFDYYVVLASVILDYYVVVVDDVLASVILVELRLRRRVESSELDGSWFVSIFHPSESKHSRIWHRDGHFLNSPYRLIVV